VSSRGWPVCQTTWPARVICSRVLEGGGTTVLEEDDEAEPVAVDGGAEVTGADVDGAPRDDDVGGWLFSA